MNIKNLLLTLTSLLLLTSCNDEVTTSEDNNNTNTGTITDDTTNTNSGTTSDVENKWTCESIMNYVSNKYFGYKAYSYDSDEKLYYSVITFEDSEAKNKEDALDYIIDKVDVPTEFVVKEDKQLDVYDDDTPLIYSLYQYNDVVLELQTYEDRDTNDNIVAVNCQMLSYLYSEE